MDPRADAVAWHVVDVLPAHPVLTLLVAVAGSPDQAPMIWTLSGVHPEQSAQPPTRLGPIKVQLLTDAQPCLSTTILRGVTPHCR